MPTKKQEAKVLNLVNHGADPIEDLTSAMINEWLAKGWRLYTVLTAPYKVGNLEMPALCVVLVRDVIS